MATSRLEKLGTIFSRVTSLMKCGAISPNDKPLWYDIYQAFPPIDEPSFARRVTIKKVKPIFYPEDRIRAKFHGGNYVQSIRMETLEGGITTSDVTQKVISVTGEIMKQEPNLNEDDALKKAVEKLTSEKAFDPKSKSMFKSTHRKTARATTSVDTVNLPHDSSTFKNIAEKDVDVTNILISQPEQDSVHYKTDSIADEFKKASKKVKGEKLTTDDSLEEK
ncbi:small ribosomal subunit protein mS23 [Planococcus citri]|uniref:small ribosomal subunit protein mS23 n=1 Tax=Planococcus citri TaxID=170843 RepID=UPI0031F98E82